MRTRYTKGCFLTPFLPFPADLVCVRQNQRLKEPVMYRYLHLPRQFQLSWIFNDIWRSVWFYIGLYVYIHIGFKCFMECILKILFLTWELFFYGIPGGGGGFDLLQHDLEGVTTILWGPFIEPSNPVRPSRLHPFFFSNWRTSQLESQKTPELKNQITLQLENWITSQLKNQRTLQLEIWKRLRSMFYLFFIFFISSIVPNGNAGFQNL